MEEITKYLIFGTYLIKESGRQIKSRTDCYHMSISDYGGIKVDHFCPSCMSNSVRNGIIWVGLSTPQGDKGGGLPNKT